MSLHLNLDNDYALLAQSLLNTLDAQRQNPLLTCTIVVPDLCIGKWLLEQDAKRHGISAGLQVETMTKAWSFLLRGIPGADLLNPLQLRWPIFLALGTLPDEPVFARYRQQVASGSLDRLILADTFAGNFANYLSDRRDWINCWRKGIDRCTNHEQEAVTGWIWRKLLHQAGLADAAHPYEAFIQRIENLSARHPDNQPAANPFVADSLWLFGQLSLSSDQYSLLAALSTVIEIYFFAPDICLEYWEDVPTRRHLLENMRSQGSGETPDRPETHIEQGADEPTALGLWGKSQQIFMTQLSALQGSVHTDTDESFRERPISPPCSALEALKKSIQQRSNSPWQALSAEPDGHDDSILLHCTASQTRQAEVLHEQILDALEAGISPDDIAIYCTDLKTAWPCLSGVLNGLPEELRVPFSVVNPPTSSSDLTSALSAWMELCSPQAARISLTGLSAWLRHPCVLAAFSLHERDIDGIDDWWEKAGAHYIFPQTSTPNHFCFSEVPRLDKHCLRQAIYRILLGIAIPQHWTPVGCLLPIPGVLSERPDRTFSSRTPATTLLEHVLLVLEWLERFVQPACRPLSSWCELLQSFAQTVFRKTEQAFPSQTLAELTAPALGTRPADITLELSAFRKIWQDTLPTGAPSVRKGGVTIRQLGPSAAIPFRVVYLFGMEAGKFPRKGTINALDLIRHYPRFGDRSSFSRDRGLFLDAVLAAKDRLGLFYQGQNLRSHSTVQNPSTLVTELQEICAQSGFMLTPIEHPIHPFSPEGFAENVHPKARGFNEDWLRAAQAILSTQAPFAAQNDDDAQATPRIPPAGAPQKRCSIRSYQIALSHPAQHYLRHRHGIVLPKLRRAHAAAEPLVPEVQSTAIKRHIEQIAATASRPDTTLAALMASPHTAAGYPGLLQAQMINACGESLRHQLDGPVYNAVQSPLPVISQQIHDTVLWMPQPTLVLKGDLCVYAAFPLNLPLIVQTWLALALWGACLGKNHICAKLCTPHRRYTLTCPDPPAALAHAYQWYHRLADERLPIFPNTWFAYAMSAGLPYRPASNSTALCAAANTFSAGRRGKLRGSDRLSVPEIARPAYIALYRDAPPTLNTALAFSDELYGPILAHIAPDKLEDRHSLAHPNTLAQTH